LTALTHNVGISAAIPSASQTLDQIELVPLPDRRILVVLVTRDRIVRNRVVTLDQDLPADMLSSIRNYINLNFSGWELADARQELERRLRAENAYYDALLKRVNLLYARGFLDAEFDPSVHMEGASYLIALDLHLTHENMRQLLRALEEKKRILQLLDRFLEQPAGEVSVHVGLGDLHSTMRELSLIGIQVAAPGGVAVKIAVLGPMRMHYEKVMAAVLSVGRTLQNLPS
jgi:heat-inducible transcriptional repressor